MEQRDFEDKLHAFALSQLEAHRKDVLATHEWSTEFDNYYAGKYAMALKFARVLEINRPDLQEKRINADTK